MTIFNMFNKTMKKIIKNYDVDEISGEVKDIEGVINNDLEYFFMRKNQQEVFDLYRTSSRLFLIMPPGSGKSAAVKFSMAWKMKHNISHKVIIAVPQTFISKSFGKTILCYPEGYELTWDSVHDLCNTADVTSKTNKVVKFFQDKYSTKSIPERVLITTHMTLQYALKQLKHNPSNFDNTSIIIDEAHHSLYDKDVRENKILNKIGEFVAAVNGNKKCDLWCITATPFRGDFYNIIPDEYQNDFDKYFLALDQHWKDNIKHIDEFSYDFVIYKSEKIFDNIKEIIKAKRKSIIFCPYQGHLVNGSSKIKFKNQLEKTIKEVWPDCRILDLITKSKRESEKKALKDKPHDIDIVLTLKIFDEGSDWIYAEDCLDLTPPNTLRLTYQRFGRLWRDHIKKHKIAYYSFLPYESTFENEEDRRKHLSQAYNIFVTALLMEEIVSPIPYPKTVKGEREKKNNLGNPFEEAFPDESKRQKILQNVTKQLLIEKSIRKIFSSDDAKEIIKTIIISNGVKDTNNKITNHIAKMLRRTCEPNVPDIDVSWMIDAGFDKIWKNEILDSILAFGTGVCGVSHFDEFRLIYEPYKQKSKWVKKAEVIALKNNGWLPYQKTLIKNGLHKLVRTIHEYPELFSHIPQLKFYNKNSSMKVKEAEKLAEQNNGILPHEAYLKKNHGAIYKCKAKNPELFEHIPQKVCIKTCDVKIQELLELINNIGYVPNAAWLISNGWSKHYKIIKNHPEIFNGLKQKYRNSFRIIGEKHVKKPELCLE